MTKEPHQIKASNYKWENALTCGTVDELANRSENKKGILRNFARLLVVGDVGGASRVLGVGRHFSFGIPSSLQRTWEEHLARSTLPSPWRRWILLPIDYGASRHNSFDWLGQDKGTPRVPRDYWWSAALVAFLGFLVSTFLCLLLQGDQGPPDPYAEGIDIVDPWIFFWVFVFDVVPVVLVLYGARADEYRRLRR